MKKLSYYNEYTIKNNKTYVYNLKYSNVISIENKSIEQVKRELIDSNDKQLLELGFVTDESNEHLDTLLWYNSLKYRSKTLNIMLIMTYNCNLECNYCFENLDKNLLNQIQIDIDKVCNFIIQKYKAGNYEELELHYFGGEPILEVNRIKEIHSKLIEANIKIKSNVITNGVLLNEENVMALKENNISQYQITLDGPKEIHDKRRKSKDNTSSFDAIIKNLQILINNKVNISIRINVDSENVDHLENLYNEIPKNFFDSPRNSIYISPVVGCKKGSFINTLKDRTQVIKKAWKTIKEKNLKIAIFPPVYAPCPYHSIESAFYMDLKGNIYTCGGFVGKTEKIEQFFSVKKDEFYERINYKPAEKCLKCSFFYVCMGGCHFEGEALGNMCQKPYLKEIYDEYYTGYVRKGL
jgi:uncharacterized protein